jgi:pyruvate kinase
MEIVCTIGPSTFKSYMIRQLWCAGVTIFRLNLSYVDSLGEIDKFVKIVREETEGKTCLDTHGLKYCPVYQKEPAFTKFDIVAILHGQKLGVDQVAVSFAQSAEAVKKAKELNNGKFTVAKLESKAGMENKTEIISEADAVLIDRGDLSKSIPITEVPNYCQETILIAKGLNTPVWVATNLLESMVGYPQPTMGEVNDVASLLLLGVDGLVLAAETAIGKYPIKCVEFIQSMTEIYKFDQEDN